MKHISLFNGVGGFQLAAEWMGWENVASCEIDEWCNKVTKYHFPNCIQYGDIKTTDFTIYRGQCDILTGGDPCQPHSFAGKRKGISDERYLWPEMYRAFIESGAAFLVNENVIGSISNGVLDRKTSDLEGAGYAHETFVLPAHGFGADHKRNRVFIVAYPKCEGLQGHNAEWENIRQHQGSAQSVSSDRDVLEGRDIFKGYSKYIRGSDGLSRRLDKYRVKALGNAIVPQVALQIFKAIEAYNNLNQKI